MTTINNSIVSADEAQYKKFLALAKGDLTKQAGGFVHTAATNAAADKAKYWFDKWVSDGLLLKKTQTQLTQIDYTTRYQNGTINTGGIKKTTPRNGSGGNGGAGAHTTPPAGLDAKKIIYNVGMVSPAYFRTQRSVTGGGNDTSFASEMAVNSNNRPTYIQDPNKLWNDQNIYAHKGMILIHVDNANPPTFDGAMTSSATTQQRYGFQFHYNPAVVTLAYAGIANTSAGYEASGQDKFALAGADISQSNVEFQILLNRKYDFMYYNSDGTLKKGVDAAALYGGKAPTVAEQKDIYNKGTMYDVEFLLAALLGYKVKTKLRGTTADIGYVSGRQIEVHLGKSMRYLGRINGFTVNHDYFDQRMVPTHSTISIMVNRQPDQVS